MVRAGGLWQEHSSASVTAATSLFTSLLCGCVLVLCCCAAVSCAGPHPFPFHVLCVAMHAVASVLVLGLCQHLFAVLEDSYRPAVTQPVGEPAKPQHSSAAASADQVCGQGRWQQLVMWQQQPRLWRLPSSSKYRAQALIAGLMFALHPIHTEVSAGLAAVAAGAYLRSGGSLLHSRGILWHVPGVSGIASLLLA